MSARATARYGLWTGFQSWSTGISPEILTRFGDRSGVPQFVASGSVVVGTVLLLLNSYGSYTSMMDVHAGLEAAENNRRSFYGKDLDAVRDPVLAGRMDGERNIGYLSVSEKSGLLVDLENRMAAPARHERPVLQARAEISPQMLEEARRLRDRRVSI